MKTQKSYSLEEVMEKLTKNLQTGKLKTKKKPKNPVRSLYQTLCSHTLSDVLPETDMALLEKYTALNTAWYPAFFSEKPLFKTTSDPCIFLLLETGANFSPQYQKKTLAHFKELGFSPTFLQILSAAQKQMANTLLLSPHGCYPDPRPPTKLKKKEKMTALEKDIRHFHDLYPVELLTNILNAHNKTNDAK